MSIDYTPRFIFDITEEQKARVDKLLSVYGLRKAIFSPLLDEVLDLIEEHGGMAIGIMLSKKVPIKEVIPSMKRADEMGKLVGGKK